MRVVLNLFSMMFLSKFSVGKGVNHFIDYSKSRYPRKTAFVSCFSKFYCAGVITTRLRPRKTLDLGFVSKRKAKIANSHHRGGGVDCIGLEFY